MTVDLNDRAAVEQKLWLEIEDNRYGMLAASGGVESEFQPMTAFSEPESARIWFYTRNDTELAARAQNTAPATFIVISKDHELQASIRGGLRASNDVLHRDKFWSPMVAAWFPGGKDDPHLTMLCLDCTEARVWISEKRAFKVGWEVAKANLTGSEPDVGGRALLKFRR